jgi:hypothetical protein
MTININHIYLVPQLGHTKSQFGRLKPQETHDFVERGVGNPGSGEIVVASIPAG